jgi:NhaP-type Na+/H+ and K+/H+ antiporter
VSVIVSLMLSFTGIEKQIEGFHRVLYLVVGVVALWLVARSKWVNNQLTRVIKVILKRKWRSIEIRDYYDLLHLSEGYGISELTVEAQDWTAGKTLEDLRLSHEGFNVLGIRRDDGSYIATPRGATRIMEGDIVLLYGKRDRMEEFESRLKGPEGDQRHHEAVKRHREQLQDQDRQEQAREREWEEKHGESA